jgi:hypothetical protein
MALLCGISPYDTTDESQKKHITFPKKIRKRGA